VTQDPEQPTIVTLRSGDARLGVAPEAGGCITRYAVGDFDLLRPASPEAIATKTPTEMSCFPLVPFSNRIRDARLDFHGRTIELTPNFPPEPHAIHGHGWTAEWDVVDSGEDRLTIQYRHAADDWPFPYLALQTFELSDVLQVTLEVVNTGDGEMPLGFGLHPFFVRTDKTRITAPVDKVWLSDEDAMPADHVALPSDMRLPDGIDPNDVALDNNFTGWQHVALIEWLDRGAQLTMTAEGPFGVLVVFTPPGEDFACAEPATNVIDGFNLEAAGRDDTGTIHLQAGGRSAGTVTFAPEL
jgi:aldose 1-epimerase